MLRGIDTKIAPTAPGVTSRRLRLVVPGLIEAPVVGDGCCSFFPAEDALAEALGAWPGVLGVEVDVERGLVDLRLGSPSPAVSDLVGTVSELGYPVEAVQGDHGR